MNHFNTLLNVQIFGESHGEMVGVCIDNVPPGIALHMEDFAADLERRKGGQKGTTPRVESDLPHIVSGWFNGYTTGAPLTMLFANENVRSADYEAFRAVPRPGHADFVAQEKFKGFQDYRGSGHFSARLTVGIVAAGVIAKKMMPQVIIAAEIEEVAGETDVERGLAKAIAAKDSVGGIIGCRVRGIPPGWGEPFWDSVESKIAHALFSIPAVKGIEFGAGFAAAIMFGSTHNDPIIDASGGTKTNHAGGIVGGISNGNELRFRLAIKPTPSTPKTQESWNFEKGKLETFSVKGRHDLCVALRAPVIVEAMTALVLADLMMIQQARNNSYGI